MPQSQEVRSWDANLILAGPGDFVIFLAIRQLGSTSHLLTCAICTSYIDVPNLGEVPQIVCLDEFCLEIFEWRKSFFEKVIGPTKSFKSLIMSCWHNDANVSLQNSYWISWVSSKTHVVTLKHINDITSFAFYKRCCFSTRNSHLFASTSSFFFTPPGLRESPRSFLIVAVDAKHLKRGATACQHPQLHY